jgi:transposase
VYDIIHKSVYKLLTVKQREELLKLHRKESKQRYGDRTKALLLLDADWPTRKIAEALLLDENTVRNYKELYKAGGGERLCSDAHQGRASFLISAELSELRRELTKNIYLILDNAGCYRGKEVGKYLKRSKVTVLYLPPYSPNLNLIERLWKFFKKICLYNKYYETFREFKSACLRFFKPEQLKNHFSQLRTLITENFQFVSV